jgi:hypothetical protein
LLSAGEEEGNAAVIPLAGARVRPESRTAPSRENTVVIFAALVIARLGRAV